HNDKNINQDEMQLDHKNNNSTSKKTIEIKSDCESDLDLKIKQILEKNVTKSVHTDKKVEKQDEIHPDYELKEEIKNILESNLEIDEKIKRIMASNMKAQQNVMQSDSITNQKNNSHLDLKTKVIVESDSKPDSSTKNIPEKSTKPQQKTNTNFIPTNKNTTRNEKNPQLNNIKTTKEKNHDSDSLDSDVQDYFDNVLKEEGPDCFDDVLARSDTFSYNDQIMESIQVDDSEVISTDSSDFDFTESEFSESSEEEISEGDISEEDVIGKEEGMMMGEVNDDLEELQIDISDEEIHLFDNFNMVQKRLIRLVEDNSMSSLWLWPMSKRDRKLVHLMAREYRIESKSTGSGNMRLPVLTRTKNTSFPNNNRNIIKILELAAITSKNVDSEGTDVPNRFGNSKTKNVQKTKKGKKENSFLDGFIPGDNSRIPPGHIVGFKAKSIDDSNIGHQMLKKMGWNPGNSLGVVGDGIRN
ncbi:hypothetical protein BB559_003137, partial [Furculomyces boomerangus]